jgi:hypothetical protein
MAYVPFASLGAPLAVVAAAALTALAPDASAQVQVVAPYYAAVTQDSTTLRAGASERFYSVATLKRSQIVIVDGEGASWHRVLYPAGLAAFVRAEDATATDASVTLTRDSRLRAASQVQGWAGSWQVLLDAPLTPGASFTLLEPVKEGAVVVGYKIQPPAEARGFVAASRLRRATPDEVSAAKAAGQQIAELPASSVADSTTTALKKDDPLAVPPHATTTTTRPIGDTSPITIDQGGGAQPINGPTSQPGAQVGTSQDIAKASGDMSPEALEQVFQKVWKEPIISSEVDELVAQYQSAIARVPEDKAGLKRALEQRVNALNIRREFRETLRRQQDERAKLDQRTTELAKQVEEWTASRVYTIVGVLQPSTVYDGQRLPQMYRVVSVGGTSPRTLGYIRRTTDLDLDRYLGQIVGVIGDTQVDRSLQLNLITPVRVDPLKSDATSIIPGAASNSAETIPGAPALPAMDPASGVDPARQPK